MTIIVIIKLNITVMSRGIITTIRISIILVIMIYSNKDKNNATTNNDNNNIKNNDNNNPRKNK